MKTHNKPVIFMDFGGVYFSEGGRIASRLISKKFRLPEKKIYEMLKTHHKMQEYRRGKLTYKHFIEFVSKCINVSKKQAKQIEEIYHSSYKPLKGMPQLVKKIRKQYRIVSLSGNTPERVKYLEKKYKMLKHFHEHHFSFDYGLTKDDGASLFTEAAKKMHLIPEDCIVVDDKKSFLGAVRKTGAKTILFKNAKQLEAELRKIGVEI